MNIQVRICPKCKEVYIITTDLSGENNNTEICAPCDLEETLETFICWDRTEEKKSNRRV